MQLAFPLPPPVGAQPARHDQADKANQPEPKAEAGCRCCIGHQFHSSLNATSGSTRVARRAGSQLAKVATSSNSKVAAAMLSGSFGLKPNSKRSVSRVA